MFFNSSRLQQLRSITVSCEFLSISVYNPAIFKGNVIYDKPVVSIFNIFSLERFSEKTIFSNDWP
jgi:hypothetical protein